MSDYLECAIELARHAGKIMHNHFNSGIAPESKQDETIVTIADKKINDLVLETLSKQFPDHGILAEEGSKVDGEDYIWICDPIDGTIPYLHGVPVSTFMLALTHKGKSVLGVIYDPFQKRLFTAEKDQGAFLNGKTIQVSDQRDIDKAFIGLRYSKRAVTFCVFIFSIICPSLF